MQNQIRDAVTDDAAGIKEIYNDAVANTTAIWNDIEVDTADRAAWLEDRQNSGYPVLVAVDTRGQVLGYASFGDWRSWDGYRHTVEHSVYVRSDSRGFGIGKTLMDALIERARRLGKHVMIGAIEANNEASIRLHQKFGFVEVGRLREVGTKFGKWLDLLFFELQLDERAAPDGSFFSD